MIVEAGEHRGTVHQGWAALRLGRTLYVLESLVGSNFDRVNKLQELGAQVLSDNNCALLLESLPEASRLEGFAEALF